MSERVEKWKRCIGIECYGKASALAIVVHSDEGTKKAGLTSAVVELGRDADAGPVLGWEGKV